MRVAPSTFHYLIFVSVYLFWFVYGPFWQLKEHHPGVDTGSFAWTNQPLLLGITGSNRQIQALEKGTCTSGILATISLLHSNTLTGMRKIQELTSKNWEPKKPQRMSFGPFGPTHVLIIVSSLWVWGLSSPQRFGVAVVKVSHKWWCMCIFIYIYIYIMCTFIIYTHNI